jgi:hypothetical protein
MIPFMEQYAPGKIFHPVRDVGSGSDRSTIDKAQDALHLHAVQRETARVANFSTLCLLTNPWPLRPSYNCAIGCPHYLQKTCPERNCMYDGSGTYYHMAFQACMRYCTKSPMRCPVYTGTAEAVRKLGPGFGV